MSDDKQVTPDRTAYMMPLMANGVDSGLVAIGRSELAAVLDSQDALRAENEALRSLLAKIVTVDVEVETTLNGVTCLGFDYSFVDITEAEAELFATFEPREDE